MCKVDKKGFLSTGKVAKAVKVSIRTILSWWKLQKVSAPKRKVAIGESALIACVECAHTKCEEKRNIAKKPIKIPNKKPKKIPK